MWRTLLACGSLQEAAQPLNKERGERRVSETMKVTFGDKFTFVNWLLFLLASTVGQL
jgi:hypothetical protein